jgi:ABC-type uncharacterized transport system involved in gliding motility, auxiliary component
MKPGLAKTLAVSLLAVVLLLINFLAGRLPVRGDLTAGKIYTLSDGTRALLDKIEDPVTLQFYATRDTAGLPTQYKNFANRVEEMLRAYVRASKGKLSLEVIAPAPDTPEEEKAQAAGLQAQQAPVTGEPFYLGLVAIQADQQKTIPTFSPQREELIEYDVSALIHSVQQVTKPRLGLLTKLPLAGQPFNMMNPRPSRGQLIRDEWARSFEIVTVESDFTELPANLDALAVLHPTGLKPAQEFAIDQFILSGKPVLLAVDPSSTWFKRQGGQQMMFGGPSPDASSDLPTLLKAYGIKYDPQQVVGDHALATPVNAGNGQVARMPVWLSLTEKNLNTGSPATAQLGSLLFVESGSLSVDTREGRDVIPLVETTDAAGTVPAFTVQFSQPEELSKTLVSGTEKKLLAALVRGPLETAFPAGKPRDDSSSSSSENKDSAADAEPLKKGVATLLVVADTDWLLDDFSVRRQTFFGQEMIQPLNDNLFLGSNALEFLAGSPDLIALRGKRSAQRPFTVVAEMEAAAQKKYNAQLSALEARISEVQAKLSELQRKSPEGGRLVATPEVLKTIEEFQAQELQMRRERRDIRRALREDIDALETKLLVINLLATPVLLGAFGLWFARHRRVAA